MTIFSIIGWSGSGKSALITGLISVFKARGRRVLALKHAPHGHTLQPEAKDTARFLEAGADAAFLLGTNELLRMERVADGAAGFARLCGQAGPGDVLLLEGLRPAGVPVIEVLSPSQPNGCKAEPSDRVATVGQVPPPGEGRPHFRPDDFEAIARFMETHHE